MAAVLPAPLLVSVSSWMVQRNLFSFWVEGLWVQGMKFLGVLQQPWVGWVLRVLCVCACVGDYGEEMLWINFKINILPKRLCKFNENPLFSAT